MVGSLYEIWGFLPCQIKGWLLFKIDAIKFSKVLSTYGKRNIGQCIFS